MALPMCPDAPMTSALMVERLDTEATSTSQRTPEWHPVWGRSSFMAVTRSNSALLTSSIKYGAWFVVSPKDLS